MNKAEARERLQRQCDVISSLQRRSEQFKKWYRDTEIVIEHIFGADTRHLKDFQSIPWRPMGIVNLSNPGPAWDRAFESGRESARAVLNSMIDEIDEYWTGDEANDSTSAPARVERICSRFHIVARQLRDRHDHRPTIDINDEYDVQDLLHALLRIDFDDVRPEEWTPSYAGKSARVDFLLKEHSLVVEVKRTRRGLGIKDIGDQLIIDIARYRQMGECRRLICFVYDPEGLIGNPASLATDLSGDHGDLNVQVIVAPHGA